MAVTTTMIAGTDSLSGSRITINDNFKTLEDALNSVLSAFDIVSGRFDNSLYGSANDILTNGIVINGTGLTNALTVNTGNIQVLTGNVVLAETANVALGNLLVLENENTIAVGATYPTWDFRSPGALDNEVGGIIMPHLTAAGFTAIGAALPGATPANGTICFMEAGPAGTPATGEGFPLAIWWNNGPSGATWYYMKAGTTAF